MMQLDIKRLVFYKDSGCLVLETNAEEVNAIFEAVSDNPAGNTLLVNGLKENIIFSYTPDHTVKKKGYVERFVLSADVMQKNSNTYKNYLLVIKTLGSL